MALIVELYNKQVKKHLRAQEIARENGLPCVYLGRPCDIIDNAEILLN